MRDQVPSAGRASSSRPLYGMLRAAGFSAIDDVDASALVARFCKGRTAGLEVAPLLHIVGGRF